VAPALSPDGSWIAYVSNESGRNASYVRPFPELTRTTSEVSTAGGVEPRWSGDGRELYCRTESDELISVALEPGGDILTVSARRVFFSGNDYLPANAYQATYDVAPGGQRYMLSRRVGTDFEQFIVVENFLVDLRRALEP
jgi:hypothetical protein